MPHSLYSVLFVGLSSHWLVKCIRQRVSCNNEVVVGVAEQERKGQMVVAR